jgi:hypothetical protein
VFSDIKPAAKHHLLIVTKQHIPNAKALNSSQKHIGELFSHNINVYVVINFCCCSGEACGVGKTDAAGSGS